MKTFVDSRQTNLQYVDLGDRYVLLAFDGFLKLTCFVPHVSPVISGSTQEDFENNYKTRAETNSSSIPQDYISQAVKNKQAFTASTGLETVDTNTEKDLMLLTNPSVSGKRVLVTHLKYGTDSASVRSVLRAYANPTISANGTALTSVNTYFGGTPPTSVVNVYKFPTITARGLPLNMDIAPAGSAAKGTSRYYWLEAGNSILITTHNSSANAKSFGDIYWVEGI